VRRSSEENLQGCCFGECAEVPVARQQWCFRIKATLSDQRITQTSLGAVASTLARNEPARLQNPGWISTSGSSARRLDTSAVIFGSLSNSVKTGGAHEYLPVFQTLVQYLDIFPSSTLKKGDPRTRVGCHHRSTLRSVEVREKRTLPRSPRSFAYACDAATSCNPVRTVWVTPVPVARCALSSSPGGISTVILRALSICC